MSIEQQSQDELISESLVGDLAKKLFRETAPGGLVLRSASARYFRRS